jgi:hypothetical protein
MGRSGRFGKYGEYKRFERLHQKKQNTLTPKKIKKLPVRKPSDMKTR